MAFNFDITQARRMLCKHGNEIIHCPVCTSRGACPSGSYLLLGDGEWYPADLLVFDLEDDVFWPQTPLDGVESMDWSDLPCICDTIMEPQGNSTSSDKNNSQSSGNEGIIVNNFYSNQYQNSIDLSATSGNAGSGAAKPEGQLGNLLGSVTNAFATALPLLADQNTEEMENLSDRVAKDIAGNTATNTQSTVGRLFGYGARHAGEHPTSCADTATDDVLAAERYYTFQLAPWTQAQTPFSLLRVPLPHALAGEDGGVFGSTLRRHYLVKCGWRVQVQCNASQFHEGCLLVFLAPEFPTKTDFSVDSQWVDGSIYAAGSPPARMPFTLAHCNPWQWTLFPHQFLNLRTNTTVDLEVPYVSIGPSVSWTQHAQWTLVVAVITPLQFAAGSSPNVDITCSIQPVKPVFNGLRHETVLAQSPVPVTVREHIGTWYSTLPDKTVPVYGKTPTAPHDYMVGRFKDLLEIAKVPTFLGNGDSPDPYITTQNSVPTTPLATYQVTLACRCMTNTILAAVARNFTQYRGSLNYTFIFTGTAMAKGKFLISYTPPGAGQPTTRDQAMQGTYAIWDLGLNSSYNFTVPFISPTHFRLTTYDAPSIVNVDGWLTVWQLTPLTFPVGCPPTADIITMLSAGSDFTLKMPVSPVPFMPQGVDNAEKGEVSQDDASTDFVAEPVYLPENQTNIKFFYDRAAAISVMVPTTSIDNPGAFVYQGSQNRPNNLVLTPLPQFNGGDEAGSAAITEAQSVVRGPLFAANSTAPPFISKQDYSFLMFSPFTYYKCDLEVVLSQNAATTSALLVRWSPTGAPATASSMISPYVSTLREGRNVQMQGAGPSFGSQISFTIPYNSPLSVLPASWFNGFANFDNSGNFGLAPNADFGKILIQGTTSQYYTCAIRYKNMRVFCPRPTLAYPWPAATTTRIVSDSPFPLLELESPYRYRADVLITFRPTDITFTIKVNSQTVDRHVVIWHGLTVPGQIMVCMGMVPATRFPNNRIKTYHAIFTTDTHEVFVEIFRGRWRPWKQPIRSESFRSECPTLKLLLTSIKNYYKAFFDLKLQHDVETNPGPAQVFQEQGAVLTKSPVPTIQSFVTTQLQSMIEQQLGPISDIQQTISVLQNITEMWQQAEKTLNSPEFWSKVLMKSIKMIAATVLWYHNPDATTTLCLAAMTGADICSSDTVFAWLKKKLSPVFRTGAPPTPVTPQDPIRQANGGFQLAKNIEWATKLIKSIVDWVTSWFKAEEKTPQHQMDQLLLEFPTHVTKVLDLRAGKCAYKDCTASFEYFEKLYTLAVQVNRVPLATLCEKFRNKHDHAQARVEPVCIVLRGKAGQGKSLASQLIAQAVSKLSIGRQSVYSMPPDSDYMDGYENQYAVIMDDLGQNPDGQDFTVFCQMVSSTNFLPNMAHLERKGIPFTSQCIIATTNLPSFRPATIAFTPAVDRRITFDYTVVAGDDCQDANGCLDMKKALASSDKIPKLACYKRDCPIFHKKGLKFKCKKTQEVLNLTQVVEKILDVINHKNECLSEFNTLIEQSPSCCPLEPVISCLRQRCAAVEDELTELQEAFAAAQERTNILSDWMKISAIVFAALASLGAVCKIVKNVKQAVWPSAQPVVLAENEQAAYSGRVRTTKEFLEVLDLQGGEKITKQGLTLLTQSGNPVFDYEVFVAKNITAPITFKYSDGGSVTQTCLLLKDRLLVTNRHVAETDWISLTVREVTHPRTAVRCLSVNKTGKNIDLTFIKLQLGPTFKNNTNKFCCQEDVFPSAGETLTGIMNSGVPFIYEGRMINANTSVATTSGRMFNCVFQYRANTKRGWCGSALIGQVNGTKKIYGLHSAGGAGVAAGTVVSQELIKKVEEKFTQVFEPQGALLQLDDGPRIHVPRKTKIRKTIAHDIFQPKFAPAVLSQHDSRTTAKVDEVAFSKHTGNVETLPPVFDMVAKEYANKVFTLLGRDNHMLTVPEAYLGLPGLDPMDRQTSPGLPYTQQNKRRTDLIDDNGQMCLQMLTAYNKLRAGDYSGVVYQSFLKDEIRPIEKVEAAKTRVVDVPPFEHCILGRQLLGRFASKFQTHPGMELGSAIGCDPDVHWTKFAYDMLNYRYVYDVDYSNFDASHSTAIFEVLIRCFFTPENGFDSSLSDYLRSLAVSTHAYEEKRFLITGGLPSGCAATSMLNTIINNIVIRVGLFLTYKNFEFDDVQIIAYGDDLLVASNFQLDFNLVKDRLASFNYRITPANKTSTFPLISHLSDVTFLKRKFIQYDQYLFKPVMSRESLEAMVSFCKPGVLKEKLTSICMLAVHSGREVYDELFAPFRRVMFLVPEYDTMLYRWLGLFR
ncbi:polyprotein [cardiovirus F1]|uniref:Genome polyprotein n=1 Tax=cardiovirus F1 TaxID=2870373 RepID=A0A2H4RDW5_9PICO|nr:polyprotein [cardiovirus F1]ATY47698.1 polyprotein [cardiovirus F1]